MDLKEHPNADDKKYCKALKRFDLAFNADIEQRRLAVDDLLFIHAEDGQWSEDIVIKRRNRPRYTIDKISGALDQLIGNQRQIRSNIKVLPGNTGNDKGARIRTGLIRNIEMMSSADNSYDNAYEEQLICGYAGFKVVTEFESERTFDQIIKIKPIISAASSYYTDPSSEEYDKRDSMFQFLLSAITHDTFKKKYPKASFDDFQHPSFKTTWMRDWFSNDGIRLADYWYRKPIKKEIGLMSDGIIIDLDEEAAVLDELASQGITLLRQRTVESFKVFVQVMNGAEFLTEPQEWPGKYIPLIPVFGKNARVDGKIFVRGKVRKAKDAQRIYNYATSAAIEATALTPKDPYWYTETNVEGHEKKWKAFPAKNTPFMPYKPDPLNQGAPPAKTGAAQLQPALIQQITQASQDIHSTTGLEPASLGNVPELKSGKAIEAQQAMGDRGSYTFEDNLKKSKAFLGEVLLDLMPRVYDTERIVKILGTDDTSQEVEINKPVWDNGLNRPVIDEQTGEQVIVNDLSKGEYVTVISSGPAFATKQQETVQQLISLSATSEIIAPLALDLIIENMDLNNKDEIKKRVRKYMIDEGSIEPTEDEIEELGLNEAPPRDPMNDALVENLNMQTEKLISEIQNKDADTQGKIMSANKDSVAALTSLIETVIKRIDANLPMTPEDVATIEGQQALVQETQADVIENQEVAGSMPVGPVPPQQLPPGGPGIQPQQELPPIPGEPQIQREPQI